MRATRGVVGRVIFVVIAGMGMILPPVGLTLYVSAAIADARIESVSWPRFRFLSLRWLTFSWFRSSLTSLSCCRRSSLAIDCNYNDSFVERLVDSHT
jgi:hypothetical protein